MQDPVTFDLSPTNLPQQLLYGTCVTEKCSIRGLQKVQKQPAEVLCKKGVLRNFAKFTEKQLCQRLFFNKVAGWPATLFKNRL